MSYITKTNLTIGPQLGSQMSQYAGLLALSQHLGSDIVLFKEYIDIFRGLKITETFDIDIQIKPLAEANHSVYELKETVCDTGVFNLSESTNWDILGWFHMYHYWDRYRDLVTSTYKFKKPIQALAEKNIDKIRAGENYPVVSIHFRRTDYLDVSSLNLTLDYYNEAISFFLQKFPYFKLLVFSDDIEWCKENIIGENIYYSEGNSNSVDLCMMTLCDHNIIANSNFSWWGAYLNSNKKKVVICPEDYIGQDGIEAPYINKNYYPKDWIALPIKN
jgi:hypothetical protein